MHQATPKAGRELYIRGWSRATPVGSGFWGLVAADNGGLVRDRCEYIPVSFGGGIPATDDPALALRHRLGAVHNTSSFRCRTLGREECGTRVVVS